MYSVGDLLKTARRHRGWGQRQLAEATGVPQPNLAAYETGQRVPSLAMLRRLVTACGLRLRFDLEPAVSESQVVGTAAQAWRQ